MRQNWKQKKKEKELGVSFGSNGTFPNVSITEMDSTALSLTGTQ